MAEKGCTLDEVISTAEKVASNIGIDNYYHHTNFSDFILSFHHMQAP